MYDISHEIGTHVAMKSCHHARYMIPGQWVWDGGADVDVGDTTGGLGGIVTTLHCL